MIEFINLAFRFKNSKRTSIYKLLSLWISCSWCQKLWAKHRACL